MSFQILHVIARFFVGGKATSDLKNERFYQDNVGVNIAEKNSSFCELTGLYWAWQNGIFKNNQYVGLVHYRRYFAGKKFMFEETAYCIRK